MNILDEIEEIKEGVVKTSFEEENGVLGHQEKFFQILSSIGVWILLMALIPLITGLFVKAYYGYSTADIMGDTSFFINTFKGDLNCFRFAQMLNTTLIFGGSAIIMSYLINGKFLGFFSLNKSANWTSTLTIPFMLFAALPVVSFIAYQIGLLNLPELFLKMEENMMVLQEGLIGVPSVGIFLINFVMIAILPGIFEELFFRGILQKLAIQLFGRKGSHHIGIIVTGVIFGAIHLQVTNFIPIALLGILLGYIYWWTKNIWFPIIAHIFFNGFQALFYFIYSSNPNLSDIEQLEVLPFSTTFISLIAFIGFTYLFFTMNKSTAYEPR